MGRGHGRHRHGHPLVHPLRPGAVCRKVAWLGLGAWRRSQGAGAGDRGALREAGEQFPDFVDGEGVGQVAEALAVALLVGAGGVVARGQGGGRGSFRELGDGGLEGATADVGVALGHGHGAMSDDFLDDGLGYAGLLEEGDGGVALTDHGSEFVSWQRFTRFEELLVDLDVEYIASGPDKKENQGKVERWHQTIRQALRERGPLDYSSEAQLWIRALVDHYNYERPHQALGGLVPADRFWGIAEELSAELGQYRKGRRVGQCLYVACRVGERKVVISGPRSEALSILVDGVSVGGDSGPVVLRPGGRLDRGSSEPDAPCSEPGV